MKTQFLPLLVTLLLLAVFSCEPPLGTDGMNPGDAQQLIGQAQTFFDTELAPAQRGARVEAGTAWIKNKQPQWAQAATFRFDNKEVVEVPLLLDGTDPVYKLTVSGIGSKGVINKRNGVTKALFFKQKDGTLKAFVMRLILNPDYLATVSQGSKYKQLSIKTLKNGFTGFLQLCSWDDAVLDMYQYERGKIVGSTRSRSVGGKGARVAGCGEVLKWRWACVSVGRGCCTEAEETYDPTGYCCGNRDGVIDRNGAPTAEKHCEYVPYYEFECVPDEPTQPEPGTGGDDPGPGDNPGLAPADIVENFRDNKCAQSVFSNLKGQSGGISDFINAFSDGKFAKYTYTVGISQASDGLTTSQDAVTSKSVGVNVYKTVLNCQRFQEFTRLGMARTMLHESIHAYMRAYLEQQGNQNFQQTFPNTIVEYGRTVGKGHEEMARNYILPIAASLKDFDGGKQSDAYYEKLAWGGLYDTDVFRAKSPDEQQEIKNIVANEQYFSVDSKGNNCGSTSVGSCN